MRLSLIQRIVGIFMILFSTTLLPPIVVALIYHDGELLHFSEYMVLTFACGILLWYPVRHSRSDLRIREGFLVVALFWLVLSVLGSLPFHFGAHLTISDAFFEAVSAITTTGATVILGLDTLPRSLLFFRQEEQWLGGMGVIVLAVAVMPMLGVGGMQLYRAETPGPMKDDKLTPRIAHTARTFWLIYLGLTVLCALAYWLAGMMPFDALAHSLSTISTGGFSTHDASMGFFDRVGVELVADLFMLLGGINFSVHYLVLRRHNPRHYWRDTEVRSYLLFLAVLIVGYTLVLAWSRTYGALPEALRHAAFQVISVVTSTGFTTADFSQWPLMLPTLLIFSSFVGGCAGSTAGGMKVVRFVLLIKQGLRDIRQLVHPAMVSSLKLGGQVVSKRVVNSVWGFFAVYIAVFVVIMLALMADGLDQVTAFSAVATCMNNLGPGLGEVSTHFQSVDNLAKWLLALAMLLGRLEIFTLLVLFTPTFWRK